jgi:hypothetical protein
MLERPVLACLLALCCVTLTAACGAPYRDNPYDTAAATSLQARGSIIATVFSLPTDSNEARTPLPGALVLMEHQGQESRQVAGPDGRTTFDDLLAGNYNVTAHLDGYYDDTSRVSVRPGQTARSTLRLSDAPQQQTGAAGKGTLLGSALRADQVVRAATAAPRPMWRAASGCRFCPGRTTWRSARPDTPPRRCRAWKRCSTSSRR